MWISAEDNSGLIVFDNHGVLYAYGPVDRFLEVLGQRGWQQGEVVVPSPHAHHYHQKFNDDKQALFEYFPWIESPLTDDDE